MATKIKRISVNAFESVMKEAYIPTETFEWSGIEVTINKTLSFPEMMSFVKTVTESCFAEDSTYIPEVKEFITKACILEKYANFTLPSNIKLQYDLIYRTNIVDEVISRINVRQLNEICSSIDEKIDKLTMSNAEEFNKKADELFNTFEKMQSKIEGMFNGIDETDIKAITKAFADGKFDENKLIDAYIEKQKALPEA